MTREKTVWLGLGTNSGNREENLMRAIEELSLAFGKCKAQSQFVETEPWGFNSCNKFLNCVIAFDTTIPPLELLDITEEIERRLGRTTKSSGGIYHDRIIDIDILFYGREIINHERLTIPHPLMHKRSFVLGPLCQIIPHFIHPTINKSLATLLEECP